MPPPPGAPARPPRAPGDHRYRVSRFILPPSSPYSFLPAALHSCWDKGARYRAHRPPPCTDAIHGEVRAHALTDASHIAARAGRPACDPSCWVHTFVAAVATAIAAHAPTHQFHWPVLSDSDLAAFRTATRDFIVTVTDKSAVSFQLVCRKYYAERCMRDTHLHDTFASPPAEGPPPADNARHPHHPRTHRPRTRPVWWGADSSGPGPGPHAALTLPPPP
jgi:hypothetical protein